MHKKHLIEETNIIVLDSKFDDDQVSPIIDTFLPNSPEQLQY